MDRRATGSAIWKLADDFVDRFTTPDSLSALLHLLSFASAQIRDIQRPRDQPRIERIHNIERNNNRDFERMDHLLAAGPGAYPNHCHASRQTCGIPGSQGLQQNSDSSSYSL